MTMQSHEATKFEAARRATSARRTTTRGRDREFLPAALEILETPPSPVRMRLILVICAFFATALAWAYISRIDIIAVAQGKLQPTGRVKVIQPLETSRVLATHAENGHAVKAGDMLVELDPAEAVADLNAAKFDLASYRAEAFRRRAAILAAGGRLLDTDLAAIWPVDEGSQISPAIRNREERVYSADLSQLNAQVGSLRAQVEQKEAEKKRLQAMMAAEGDVIATMNQRLAMKSTLVTQMAGSRSDMLDVLQELQEKKATLAQETGQLAEADASLKVLGKDIRRAFDTFIADNAQKLAEAERQTGETTEKLNKAQARLSHMTLRSPIAGTIQASTLTTVGQVVNSGQELMRVVPEGAVLEIECYLPNKDIGFVKAGDQAVIKIESFPFTRYGTVDAVVARVARDAIPEPDAAEIEREGLRASPSLTQGGAQRTQNLVFPVTLHPLQVSISVDGMEVPLGAGMAVTAEIRTGSRRILEYVFSPLVKIASESMKER